MRRSLIDYFKKNLGKGYDEQTLRIALINQGYPRTAIELSLNQAKKELSSFKSLSSEKPKIKYEVVDEEGNVLQRTSKKSWWKKFMFWT